MYNEIFIDDNIRILLFLGVFNYRCCRTYTKLTQHILAKLTNEYELLSF